MKKILIVGKKSFIGSHLYSYLKNFFYVKILSFKNLNNKNLNYFDYVINCSIHPNYSKYKYDILLRFPETHSSFEQIRYLHICIHDNEIDALDSILDHAKHCIAAPTTHTDHL